MDATAKSEQALRDRLKSAVEAADEYERALLTTQSDELKDAVLRALIEIGFIVVDADLDAKKDDHLEDLRISDPNESGWIALGEVKGYTKGAKTEALTQFLRFNARFVQENGRLPDACWYIVNQFLGRDPSSRQLALNGKDDDVKAFAAANGLVLDTRELFKLLSFVRKGSISPSDARANSPRVSRKVLGARIVHTPCRGHLMAGRRAPEKSKKSRTARESLWERSRARRSATASTDRDDLTVAASFAAAMPRGRGSFEVTRVDRRAGEGAWAIEPRRARFCRLASAMDSLAKCEASSGRSRSRNV